MSKYTLTMDTINELLKNLKDNGSGSSSIDISAIIRCKNCKYYATNTELLGNVCNRLITVFSMEPEDFCSYGERKDEE